MTNRIDRLEKAALVARQPNTEDRRGTPVMLTARGLALIEQAVGSHVANQHAVVAAPDESEREQLSRLLRKLLISQQG